MNTTESKEKNNIYVQILPVIKSSFEVENSISNRKILLCKWNKGDFKGRFTGLIREIDLKDQQSTNNADVRVRLEDEAKSLLPKNLTQKLTKIELVAILTFTDPPAYDEYVYIVHLSENATENAGVVFDGNPCEWFEWEEIPFQNMPEDDHLWYSKVLQEGLKVTGSFTFGSWSETTLKSYEIRTVSHL